MNNSNANLATKDLPTRSCGLFSLELIDVCSQGESFKNIYISIFVQHLQFKQYQCEASKFPTNLGKGQTSPELIQRWK